MANPNRPTTFKQWRSLWHAESRSLGFSVAFNFDGRRIRMTRDLFQSLRRVRRIRDRLDIEGEVKDASWCDALLEMIREHKS